eukprot:3548472-Prorocentrum_lima.AAC.1
MREIVPTTDLPRMSIARELQGQVARVPTTLVGLANWLEECAHTLELGMGLGALTEPRALLAV